MKPPKALEMGSEFSFECRLGLVKTRDDRFLMSRMGLAHIVGEVGDSYSAASHGFHDADGVDLHNNMKRTLGHYFL